MAKFFYNRRKYVTVKVLNSYENIIIFTMLWRVVLNNFLSIGELAKLRNVNVQSLRYYEKLGILVPAYINPENGYRYYSLDQIMILDTIILCIDLGIPLKDLKNYVNTEGELEFEHLLKDGKKLANEKIRKIESTIDSINRTLQHINAQKTFQGREGYYSRYIFERYYITIPCETIMSAKKYEKNLNHLISLAKKQHLQASFPHGIISTYCNGKFTESNMFLEVLPDDASIIQKLSAGNYLCYQEQREIHSDPLMVFPQKLMEHGTTNIIISSMSPDTYKYDKVTLEFQIRT